MLWLYQRVFWEKPDPHWSSGSHPVLDLNLREVAILIPLIVLIFWIGVYPDTFLSYMHSSVEHLLENINRGAYAGQKNLIAQGILEIFQ
jgi:NADH-quinone oxidoreductase subunit M